MTEPNVNLASRLHQVMSKDSRIVVGSMSGTSADGVDVVIVHLKGHGRNIRWRILASRVIPYPPELKKRVLRCSEGGSVEDVCLLNYVVGISFARAIMRTLDESGIKKSEVDLVGSHGQTVYHMPEYLKVGDIETRCSLQVGSPAVIAEHVGLITVGDFRCRDIAVGGHGAPIISYVDWALLTSDRTGRLVQNIGGIANVTVLPPRATLSEVYAFDTGPGNMVIDEVMRILYGVEYDVDGETARRGNVDSNLLRELMDHWFIKAKPPKTAGRREFGRRFAEYAIRKGLKIGLSKQDIVATVTALTVESIVYNYDRFVLRSSSRKYTEVIVGGGGTKNRFIMERLRDELKERGLRLLTHEDLGIDSKFKESLGMAILAHEALSGIPNNVPKATGAKKAVVMGLIAL